MERKQTEIYCGGEVTKGEDVKAVNANFRLFGNWVTPDFDSPECWKAMSSMETILQRGWENFLVLVEESPAVRSQPDR